MTFMGGRIIAPAVAGTLEKKGIPLEARVQPHIEGALLVTLPVVMALMLLSGTGFWAGALLLATAVLIVVRVARWKLWYCGDRPDLLVLAAGYLWLAVGAAVTGLHLITGRDVLPALHLVAVGALGTLSCSVMLRLAWQRGCRRFPPAWQVLAIALLIAIASACRYLAGPVPFSRPGLLWLASGAWSLAFAGVTAQLLLLYRQSQKHKTARQRAQK
jgi:uncharacterized protein involved in response to NO